MIDTIYIEDEVASHPRTLAVCARFPQARRIPCGRYTEVFNPKHQSFRLQKRRPALILARKFAHFVLPTPNGYGFGENSSYYFSHMLNCLYDCRYCFLQGMYRSAHYVLFVNYEDFEDAISATLARHPSAPVWFFSGYDCDSLALEPVTGFAERFLPFFARQPRARLELRTKSTQIRALLQRAPIANCVVAFSFTPQEVSDALEHRVPPVEKRLAAMAQLQRRGWKLGLRFDPLIYHDHYQNQYRRLFAQVFTRLRADALHSVSLGPFRLPPTYHRTLRKHYPEEPLFAGPLEASNGFISYPRVIQEEMQAFCEQALAEYVPSRICYSCADPVGASNKETATEAA